VADPALDVADLPRYRDWLIADQRDLEIQDFHATEVLLGDWEDRAATARAALDGFEGRLGIHGPFVNVPISCNDPELRPIVTNRYLTGLRAAIAVGASQMVIHSPFTIWDDKNYGDKPAGATIRRTRTASSPPATRSWRRSCGRPRIMA